VTAQRLHQSLPKDQVPDELAGLTEALNAMLRRLQADFERLSDFSADLAHELRTVQSILREHAELPWSASAAALLTRVPGAQYHRLKSKVWNSRADPHTRASALSVLAC
jgi:signal transduction histidine kinase